MKIKFIMLFVAAMIYNYVIVAAQTKQNTDNNITGHVIDAKTGEHLPYVSISIKGTTIGMVTDATGHYFLKNIPEQDFTLEASYVGYQSQEIPVKALGGKTIEVNFTLKESTITMDQIVVTANRNSTNRSSAPTIVNVISNDAFARTSSNNLAEGLNYQPGLRVEYSCQNCGVPQLRINGLEGQYSQILLDSRPIFSSLASVYGLEQLPVSMIERVEVIRGGGSALFGSSAIGGVVNIITREPVRNSLMVSNTTNIIGGKSGDFNTSLNGSFVSDDYKAGVYIFGMVRDRHQYDRNGDGFSEIPKLNSETLGFRGYYKTSAYTKLTAEYHHIREFRRGGNKLDIPPHEADIAEQLQHGINGGGLSFDAFTRNYLHKFNVYTSIQSIKRNSYFGTGQNPDAYGKTDDITYVAGGQYSYSMKKLLFMPAELTMGFEFNKNNLHDEMIGYKRDIQQDVHTVGGYIQNEWQSPKLNFLIGARLDKNSQIKNVVFNPRVNLRYTPADIIRLRLSYSSGYRAPQAYNEDLHVAAVGGEVALINISPDLKPEYSHSFSASANLNGFLGSIETDFLIEGFYTNLKDVFTLVETGYDTEGNLLLERQNASGATVKGINAELTMALNNKLEFQAGYTYQKSLYKEPHQWSEDPNIAPQKRMLRSPDSYGYASINYTPIKPFQASFYGTYTGNMLIPYYGGEVKEDRLTKSQSFWDLGIKLAYDIKLSGNTVLQINAGIKNFLDSFQKDIDTGMLRDAGYIYGPSLPRTYFVGMKFSM